MQREIQGDERIRSEFKMNCVKGVGVYTEEKEASDAKGDGNEREKQREERRQM